MKYLGELAVLAIGFALAAGIVFALLQVGIAPMRLRNSQAAILSLLAVFFWIPAFANIHILLRGPASVRGRIGAGCRAWGMLACSAAMGAGILLAGADLRTIVAVFVAGMILNFGTLAFAK